MSNQERVPYTDGLLEGQGFNTYLQDGRMSDAVTITKDPQPTPPPVKKVYDSEQISDYQKLVETLEISAGAGISKWGIGVEVDAKFLNRSEFTESFLTYLVKVDVQQQSAATAHYSFNWPSPDPPHPQETYGDRFISEFLKGGAFFARVSIITKDTSMHQEIEQSAKVVFPIYGVMGQVTEDVKKSIDKIYQHSEVRIHICSIGAPPGYHAELSVGQNDDELLQLKAKADQFYKDAQKMNWKRLALLESYTNVPNFKGQFTPLDYSEAKDKSWLHFNNFVAYQGIRETIRSILPAHYEGGEAEKGKLDVRANDILEGYRTWITSVTIDPIKVRNPPPYEPPEEFLKEVLRAVRITRYYAQRLRLKGGRWTDIIDKEKRTGPDVKQLFEIMAFDFGDVIGITNVLFGRNSKDQYLCLIGRKMPSTYEQLSQLWASENKVPGIFEQQVNVYDQGEIGCIELELGSGSRDETPLFTFYAGKPE